MKYYEGTIMTEPSKPSRLDIIKYNVHDFYRDTITPTSVISKKLALPIHVMLFNLDGNMNIAMSVRSASVLGCSDVWIVGIRKYDARPEVGAKNYINVHKIPRLDDPLTFFKDNKLIPIIVEQGGTFLDDFDFKPIIRDECSVCFIMGSESNGIPKSLLDALKDCPRLTISQFGLVRSLNVSVACSIVVYEYIRQWRKMRSVITTL